MRRYAILMAVVLILASVATVRAAPPLRPAACSGGESWDPVMESDVIAGGQIEGYEVVDAAPHVPGYTLVRLRLAVQHVWKGRLERGAEIMDAASLLADPGAPIGDAAGALWAGGGGACGAFDEDPTGVYIVAGLHRAEDGTLRTNRLMIFYLDRKPYDPAQLGRLTPRLGLPITGNGQRGRASARPAGALAVAGVSLLLVGVSRLRRHSDHR